MYRFELICARLDVGSTLRHLLTTESHEARSRTQYFQILLLAAAERWLIIVGVIVALLVANIKKVKDIITRTLLNTLRTLTTWFLFEYVFFWWWRRCYWKLFLLQVRLFSFFYINSIRIWQSRERSMETPGGKGILKSEHTKVYPYVQSNSYYYSGLHWLLISHQSESKLKSL